MNESRLKLAAYLLSDEYVFLLEKAVLSRYATSTNNKDKHEVAIHLIRDFKADPDNNVRYRK